jgi:uncharacterized protein HemX
MFGLSLGLGTKLIIILGLVLSLLGTATGGYLYIQHQAAQTQLLKDQKAQLEQIIAQQNQVIEQNNAIMELSNDSTKKFSEVVDTIAENHSALKEFLSSPDAIKIDRVSSSLLKKIIEELSKKGK